MYELKQEKIELVKFTIDECLIWMSFRDLCFSYFLWQNVLSYSKLYILAWWK